MGLVTKIAVAVGFISFIVFIIFFGRLPALRGTPIGFLHRLLWIHLPQVVLALDRRLTNGQVYASSSRLIRHMMNDRHPTVLIAFILLMAIPEVLFLPRVFPTLGIGMCAVSTVIVICPYVFLFLASYVDPGYVLKHNLDFHGGLYPYDHALYIPGQMCKTCRQPKPARSKHCSVCGHCVSKMDHHCIFINGCVGYSNQHWFLLVLLSTATLTSAGAWLGGLHLLRMITAAFPPFTLRGLGFSWSEYFSFWSWALQAEPGVGSVALLCLLITPLVFGLLLYSVYLVYRGMTTNESGKWSDFQLDINDGFMYRRDLLRNRRRNLMIEPMVIGWPKSTEHIYFRAFDEPPDISAEVPGEGQWFEGSKDWKLADVDNIYDIGFMANIIDVFLPRKYLQSYLGANANDFLD